MGTQSQISSKRVGIWSVIASSWSKLSGVKGPIWGSLTLALVVYISIALAATIVGTLIAVVIALIFSSIVGSQANIYSLGNLAAIFGLGFGIIFAGLFPLWTISSFIGKCYAIAIQKARHNKTDNRPSAPPVIRRTPIFNYFIATVFFRLFAAFLVFIISLMLFSIFKLSSCNSFTCQITTVAANFIITLPIAAIPLLLIFTVPFIVDKQSRTFKALSQSIRHTCPYYFRIFFAHLFVFIIFLAINAILTAAVAMPLSLLSYSRRVDLALYITFGTIFFTITSIWLFPYLFMLVAEFYQRIVDNHSTSQ